MVKSWLSTKARYPRLLSYRCKPDAGLEQTWLWAIRRGQDACNGSVVYYQLWVRIGKQCSHLHIEHIMEERIAVVTLTGLMDRSILVLVLAF
jgi:hypothetical protein